MTREKAVRLAQKWASGGVCTLRDGEAQKYHEMALAALREQDKVVDSDQFKTNADHIRSMTDEELGVFLIGVYIQDWWDHPNDIADWLKQPYKEETND